jgi:hypothetical protein
MNFRRSRINLPSAHGPQEERLRRLSGAILHELRALPDRCIGHNVGKLGEAFSIRGS